MTQDELISALKYNITEKERILDKLIPENERLTRENADLKETIKLWIDLTEHTRRITSCGNLIIKS